MSQCHNYLSAFDLDGTLLRSNASFLFGRYLYKHSLLATSHMLQLVSFYTMHKAGFLTIGDLHQKAFQILFFKRRREEILALAESFWDSLRQSQLYPPAVKKLGQAKQRGDYLILLSSSPEFLVKSFARRFGFNDCHATSYAHDATSRFEEITEIVDGDCKARILLNLSERLKIVRERIFTYTDSLLDLPFLLASGNPHGVNPDRSLKAICQSNCWPIL